jgi:hypothetical protein
MSYMNAAGKLTNIQLELLKLFQYNLPEKQLAEIKNMLAKYFAKSATEEMDKLWEDNAWNAEIMNQWTDEHLRKQ